MGRTKPDTDGEDRPLTRLQALKGLFADRERLVSRAGAVVSTALTITVVAGLAMGYGPLKQRAGELKTVEPRVEFEWPPLAGLTSARPEQAGGAPRTWLNGEMRLELEKTVAAKVTGDPFDDDSLEAARSELIKTGWFADGKVALRRWPGGIVQVWGNWRVPVAVVRAGGRDRLIASKGELLPPSYAPGRSGFKAIIGAHHEVPTPGEAWLGGDVQAGLALLTYLSTTPGYEQIEAVDVSRFASTKTLELVTDKGNRIVWGGPVETFSPGQAHPAVRRTRLAGLFKDYGRIDTGRPRLDLRPEDSVYIHDTGVVRSDEPESTGNPTPGTTRTAAADTR
jgi:hypothetical protein